MSSARFSKSKACLFVNNFFSIPCLILFRIILSDNVYIWHRSETGLKIPALVGSCPGFRRAITLVFNHKLGIVSFYMQLLNNLKIHSRVWCPNFLIYSVISPSTLAAFLHFIVLIALPNSSILSGLFRFSFLVIFKFFNNFFVFHLRV